MEGKTFKWDVWLRCVNPNQFQVILPHDFNAQVFTACFNGEWFYGYYCEVYFEAGIPVRAANATAYQSEREARRAALEDLLNTAVRTRDKIEDECLTVYDEWSERVEVYCSELLEWMDDAIERIEEYVEHHDKDVLFDMEA